MFTWEYIEPQSFVIDDSGVLSLSDSVNDQSSKHLFYFISYGMESTIGKTAVWLSKCFVLLYLYSAFNNIIKLKWIEIQFESWFPESSINIFSLSNITSGSCWPNVSVPRFGTCAGWEMHNRTSDLKFVFLLKHCFSFRREQNTGTTSKWWSLTSKLEGQKINRQRKATFMSPRQP